MDIILIKERVRQGKLILSSHAEEERMDENLTVQEVIDAILADEILEDYPDTGRGESCLLLGFVDGKPIHIMCGWRRDSAVVVTVYIPVPPHFRDPWTRMD